jgi:hypothetical protein
MTRTPAISLAAIPGRWPLAELGLRRRPVLRVPFFVPTILTVT